MSFEYVSSPGVPTIRLKNFSGVGTVADAGRWSTSSVEMRGSWRYSLIFAVYSGSLACCASRGELSATSATAASTAVRAKVLTGDMRIPREVGRYQLRTAPSGGAL